VRTASYEKSNRGAKPVVAPSGQRSWASAPPGSNSRPTFVARTYSSRAPVVTDRLVEPTDRRQADAEAGDHQVGAAQLDRGSGIHRHLLGGSADPIGSAPPILLIDVGPCQGRAVTDRFALGRAYLCSVRCCVIFVGCVADRQGESNGNATLGSTVQLAHLDAWPKTPAEALQIQDRQAIDALAETGPGLGRPFVDTIHGSAIANLKELRPGTVRILFAFDPWRCSILLVAGDKAGQWNAWYREAIPPAERYETYLKERSDKGNRSIMAAETSGAAAPVQPPFSCHWPPGVIFAWPAGTQSGITRPRSRMPINA
jgi:hypothetical protein